MLCPLLPRQQADGSTIVTGNSGADQFLNLISNPFQSQINQSAFLASLGTSIGSTLIIAALFCLLRPHNNVVYAPRAKYADSRHAPPAVGKGVFAWVAPVLRTHEQQLVDTVGLDATLFIRFTKMCRNIFLALTVVGCGILIPVNLVAGHSEYQGFSDISTFMKLTPQYMYGSQAFWAFVVVAYLFDAIICFFLWWNYRAVARLRRAFFDSPEYLRSLHARTLLLTDIPTELRSDDGIIKITDEVKGAKDVPRAAIARNVKDLPELVEEHGETVRKLERYLANYLKDPDRLPPKRPQCTVSKNDKAYTKGQKVDAIEYLTLRIKKLEIEIKEVRELVDERNSMPYGFASYDNIADAHSVAYVARKGGPYHTTIKLAPRPHDLIWKNLKTTKKERNWKNFINNLWVALLTLIWVGPNVLSAVFLSNLSHLGQVWPAFQMQLEAHPTWWAVVQGVVSPAITSIFYFYLPAIFRRLCMSAGDMTKTSRDRHVMHKLYSFFVFNNLIVFSLFAAVWGWITAIIGARSKGEGVWRSIENAQGFNKVMIGLINVSPFWISWLLQRNLGAAVDLCQIFNLAWGSLSRRFLSPTPRELIELSAPQPFDYASYYNYFLFYGTVAICFGVLQPLVLPVTAVYFCLDSYLKKYLILYVFITKTESGGQFWRVLYNRFLFLALLGNVVVALIVVAQGSRNNTNWIMLGCLAPCPVLLGAFKWYCAHAFDDQMAYYTKGKALRDSEVGGEGKNRHRERVGVRFGNPVLYQPLTTPMVHAKSQHLLKSLYAGRTSIDYQASIAGYSDVYLDPMDRDKPGKTSGAPAPFELVHEGELDFEHFKNRPEFRDAAGGDGELFGQAQDAGSFMTRNNGTIESRSRSGSKVSERTNVAEGGVEYPRGYHQTPSALREQSPAVSFASVDVGGGRMGRMESRERLVDGAARMGRSPASVVPTSGAYGPVYTPDSTPGVEENENTSYDYFRRGRHMR